MKLQDKIYCPEIFQTSGLSDLMDMKAPKSSHRPYPVQIAQRTARREVQLNKGIMSMTNTCKGRFSIGLPAFGNKTSLDEEASNV